MFFDKTQATLVAMLTAVVVGFAFIAGMLHERRQREPLLEQVYKAGADAGECMVLFRAAHWNAKVPQTWAEYRAMPADSQFKVCLQDAAEQEKKPCP